ncbi:hypothetical protein BC835DRAFT_1343418 [Cytidiella melzeri]|nr:hypothetical protein BC835DRAFT_1343418 [Cytidiella melzeri]
MPYWQEVPQPPYRLRRPFIPFPSIIFERYGSPGVYLGDALRDDLHGLHNAESTPLLTNTAAKFTLRLNWPGCPPSCAVIHAYDHRYESRPVTLARLAYLVALKIRSCLENLSTEANRLRATDPNWLAHNVNFEDLVLVRLQHVALGSWQPVIVYSPRSG